MALSLSLIQYCPYLVTFAIDNTFSQTDKRFSISDNIIIYIIHHIGPGGNILMISLPLNTWSTRYFCSLIWREHLDTWWALSILGCGKIQIWRSAKTYLPNPPNWNPSFASVWCSWKKKCCQAHKLQTALWGVFEAGVPGLRAGSKHWKLWQQKGGSRLKTLSY